MGLLDELNNEQRAAVTAGDGPVMIVAGPGTGKTKTLTARVAWLLQQGATPDEILALTFTHKAAGEMRTRVDGLLGPSKRAKRPEITTFHALALRLLGKDERTFVSNEERLEVLRGLQRPVELKSLSIRELGLALSNAKTALAPGELWAELVQQYDEKLRRRGRRDFDDLLRDLRALVLSEPVRVRCHYVLVDEFQDTNELQYELAKLMAGEGGLFVIGDPRQSIYGFRGAGGDVFKRFEHDFSQALVVTLALNYRSAPVIVHAGNAVFGSEAAKLIPARKQSGRVRLVETLDEYREAAWLVRQIEAGVGGTGMLEAVADDPEAASFRDYAVLYRTHRAAAALIRELDESGMPFQVAGEGSPYERPELQRIVDVLESLGTGDDAAALKGAADAWTWAELRVLIGEIEVAELVREIADRIGGYDEAGRQRELAQLVSVVARFGKDVAAAARYFVVLREAGFYDPAAEVVTLATIHAAKGLEFEHVFVLGAEEGLLPYARPGAAADLDEERRLFYVAVTRSKRRLDLLHTRTRGGKRVETSRFIAPLAFERVVDPDMARQERKRAQLVVKKAQGKLF